jgi:hypothetical protein
MMGATDPAATRRLLLGRTPPIFCAAFGEEGDTAWLFPDGRIVRVTSADIRATAMP